MTLLNIVGGDYEFENIKLHNPSIAEISEKINEENNFLFALKILSSSLLERIPNNIPFTEITNFDVFLGLILGSKTLIDNNIISKAQFYAINDLLQLLFLDYKISLGKNELIFSKDNNILIMNSNNFQLFQEIIQKMFKTSSLFSNDSSNKNTYNPATDKAKQIAEKLKQSELKVSQLKGNCLNYKTALIENYIMIICVGLNLSPKQVSNLTLYQIITLFERIRMKIEWDLDVDCRLAGGDPGDRPDNWMSIL